MANEQAAEVLQDVAEKVNAEESTTAGPKAGEETDAQATQTGTDGEGKRKGGWLRKLTKAEQERDFWRDEALRNRPKESAPVKAETVEDKPPVRPVRPKESDFSDYEKFAAARDKYEDAILDYGEKVAEYKVREADKGREQKAKEQEMSSGWAARVAEAKKTKPDFEEVAFSPDIPMSNAVMHAIVTSELGTEVAYWLGQNPDEAERISALEPVAAIREIGKIESRLTGTQSAADKEEDKPEPPAAATSRAPRPPDTVRKARSTDSTELRDDLPYKEWERRRNAQLALR